LTGIGAKLTGSRYQGNKQQKKLEEKRFVDCRARADFVATALPSALHGRDGFLRRQEETAAGAGVVPERDAHGRGAGSSTPREAGVATGIPRPLLTTTAE
jgi:hypothetical protein